MANLKKRISTVLAATVLSVSSVSMLSAFAKDLGANGDLTWYGGQTNKVVYSDISRKVGRVTNYMVRATVKVGGNTYTSGWLSNHAYKEAKRKWYANESYYYDYYVYFL